jgi:methylenetetrahydrofolate dehydrogenase (NADP+)/methenyltetrahydrofolate cyclohydrolase
MDGTALAQHIVEQATTQAAAFTAQTGQPPCLATVLVGDDAASLTYVRMKHARCERAGIRSRHIALAATTTTAELVDVISALSADPAVHGILLQHPVGPHIDERAAFEAIAPAKDVDGVTMTSFAATSFGLDGFASCTPRCIIRLLDHYNVEVAGKHTVVLGRSAILGKPAGMLLLARDATVTYCHSHTRDLPSIIRQADILIAAVGKPRFVKASTSNPAPSSSTPATTPATSATSTSTPPAPPLWKGRVSAALMAARS